MGRIVQYKEIKIGYLVLLLEELANFDGSWRLFGGELYNLLLLPSHRCLNVIILHLQVDDVGLVQRHSLPGNRSLPSTM